MRAVILDARRYYVLRMKPLDQNGAAGANAKALLPLAGHDGGDGAEVRCFIFVIFLRW